MAERLKFLPSFLISILSRLSYDKLYEIRIRADKPIRVFYDSKFYYLTKNGLTDSPSTSLTLPISSIGEIIMRAAEFSIYAVNNQLRQGYITVSGGIRIGIAGEVVYENDKIKTQKNFNSLVIRIPHEILGCSDKAFKALIDSENKNMLIISPPGCGKTTILRDLCKKISDYGFNSLLVDERNEIAACHNGKAMLDVGINTDIINSGLKDYAFLFGIRSMRPHFIITDELATKEDILAVKQAVLSGVNVIASLHAAGISDIICRPDFKDLIDNQIFGRYVFLSLRQGVGTYENILDKDLSVI